jgi:hypothetical protein
MLITSYETPGFWRRSTARRAVVLRRIAQAILPDYLTRMPFGGKRRKASGGDRTDRRRGKGRADEGSSRRRGFALLHALRLSVISSRFPPPAVSLLFPFPLFQDPGACLLGSAAAAAAGGPAAAVRWGYLYPAPSSLSSASRCLLATHHHPPGLVHIYAPCCPPWAGYLVCGLEDGRACPGPTARRPFLEFHLIPRNPHVPRTKHYGVPLPIPRPPVTHTFRPAPRRNARRFPTRASPPVAQRSSPALPSSPPAPACCNAPGRQVPPQRVRGSACAAVVLLKDWATTHHVPPTTHSPHRPRRHLFHLRSDQAATDFASGCRLAHAAPAPGKKDSFRTVLP